VALSESSWEARYQSAKNKSLEQSGFKGSFQSENLNKADTYLNRKKLFFAPAPELQRPPSSPLSPASDSTSYFITLNKSTGE